MTIADGKNAIAEPGMYPGPDPTSLTNTPVPPLRKE